MTDNLRETVERIREENAVSPNVVAVFGTEVQAKPIDDPITDVVKED